MLQLWKKIGPRLFWGKKTQNTKKNPIKPPHFLFIPVTLLSGAEPCGTSVGSHQPEPCLLYSQGWGLGPVPPPATSHLHRPTCHPARRSQPQKDRAFAAASAPQLAPHLTSTGRCPGSSSGLMSRNAAGWGLRGARGQGAPSWDPRHELTHPQVSFPPNSPFQQFQPTPKARSAPDS